MTGSAASKSKKRKLSINKGIEPVKRSSTRGKAFVIPEKSMDMVHYNSLATEGNGVVIAQADISAKFNITALAENDRTTYVRGGEVKRIHFLETEVNGHTVPAHDEDVKICSPPLCKSGCASSLAYTVPMNAWGFPFVHVVRDCIQNTPGELRFEPLEKFPAFSLSKEHLPPCQPGVLVIFKSGVNEFMARTLICKWNECTVCRPMLTDAKIAQWQKKQVKEESASSDGQSATDGSELGDGNNDSDREVTDINDGAEEGGAEGEVGGDEDEEENDDEEEEGADAPPDLAEMRRSFDAQELADIVAMGGHDSGRTPADNPTRPLRPYSDRDWNSNSGW